MPSLKDLIRLKDIQPCLATHTRSETLAALVAGLRDHPRILSFESVARELEAKADSLNTLLDGGVWLPHLRTPNVRGIVICPGSWPQPVSLDLPEPPADGVSLAILILAQQGLVTEYLATVGELARYLSVPGVIARVTACSTPDEWVATLLPCSGEPHSE